MHLCTSFGRIYRQLVRALCCVLMGVAALCNTLHADERVAGDSPKTPESFQFRDEFNGAIAGDWKPVRHDPSHVSLEKHPGKLTIMTQRGTINGNEKSDELSLGTQAKNLFLIPNPALQGGDFVATTRVVSFTPTEYWHQAGLIVYNDDDNYLKCDLEWSDGAPSDIATIMLRETEQLPEFFVVQPDKKGNTFWLRVTKRGKLYEYACSDDGDRYKVVVERHWGDGTPKSLGIFAKNGGSPTAGSIDAQFDFFEVRSLNDAERNQPAYLERQKLRGAWEAVTFTINGKEKTDPAISRFTFDGGEVVVQEKEREFKSEYTLNASTTPKQLMIASLSGAQGQLVPAAYLLEADTLQICLDASGRGVAPRAVASVQGDGQLLITLRRVKSKD